MACSCKENFCNLSDTKQTQINQTKTPDYTSQEFQDIMTDNIQNNNVNFVRSQIYQKIQPEPYYATIQHAKAVLTDQDHFPYKRYYRGHYASSYPIVDERAAGFRPRIDNCYKPEVYKKDQFCTTKGNDLCWQSGSTVTYPCRNQFLKKYADIDEIRQLLDVGCISQYR